VQDERGVTERRALVLARKASSALLDCRERRPRELAQLSLVLAGHDPQRTLERGYALVRSAHGDTVASAQQARAQGELRLRFADGELTTRVTE
jgi:exodeoxyribonuclease VII large subunit